MVNTASIYENLESLVFNDHYINDMHDTRATHKEKYEVNIDKVIFNNPATIIFWKDGTKTVVKAVNEPFDKEKGLAMAISKKYFGNKGNYFNVLKKWIKED